MSELVAMLGPNGLEYVQADMARDLERSGWRVPMVAHAAPGPAIHARVNEDAVLYIQAPFRGEGDSLVGDSSPLGPSAGTAPSDGSFPDQQDLEC